MVLLSCSGYGSGMLLNILQCTGQPSMTKNGSVYNVDSTEVETSALDDSNHSELCNILGLFHIHRECYLGQEDKALTRYD